MGTMTIEVWDYRPELANTPKMVASFPKTPESWTISDVVERYGIAEHLAVYRSFDGGKKELIRRGRGSP